MTWADWTVLVFGLSGLTLANTVRFQKYACVPGLLGQIGWFGSLTYTAQPGPFLVCVAYSAVWIWSFWKFWIGPWLDSVTTPTVDPGTTRPRSGGTTKPKLRLVSRSAK